MNNVLCHGYVLPFGNNARRRVDLEDSRCTGLSGIAKGTSGLPKAELLLFLLTSNMQIKWFSWPLVSL
jgi:hypothetical protein